MTESKHRPASAETPAKGDAASTIHVSWNGASEVRDLNEYFGNSDSVSKHLAFLDRLSHLLEP